MRKAFFGWLVFCLVFFAAATVSGERLYFFVSSVGNGWNTVGNWYVPDPGNPGQFMLAGRLPNSADDAEIGGSCNAAGTSPQLVSLTVRATYTITGGNFDVGTVNFTVPGGGSASNGLSGTTLLVRNAMNFTIANTVFANSQIIMQGGSFASVAAGITFSGTSIFNQGSFVLQPGSSISFLGSNNRFDNIGDLRGNGGTTQLSAGFQNLTFNNSGTIRADSGTLVINGNIIWTTDDGTGSFYPFTDDALIRITSTLTVPANTTTFFKGPGTVLTVGNVVVNGTLRIGGPVAGSSRGPDLATPSMLWKFDQEPGTVAVLSGFGVVEIADEGTLDWLRAAINDGFGNGNIAVRAGGTLNIRGGNNNGTDTTTMNSGTVNVYDGGAVHFRLREFDTHNSTFNIFANGTISFDFPMGVVGNGLPATTFNNLGTFDAIAGTSSNPLAGFSGPLFNNHGALNLTGTGKFQVTGGAGSGTFNVPSSLALILAANPYAIYAGVIFPGEGDVVVAKSGTLLVQEPATIPKLTLGVGAGAETSPGTVDGPGNLTITSKLTYNWGSLKGSGSLNIGEDCLADIEGTASKTVEGKVVYNFGSTTWNGDGIIQMSNGASWKNLTGGVMDIKGNGAITGGEQETFDNEVGALLMKSGGTGTSFLNFLRNYGTVQIQLGTLGFCRYLQASGLIQLVGGNVLFSCLFPMRIEGGGCEGTGIITGNVEIATNVGPAIISPGVSPGKITINGDLTMGPTATLRIEVAGLATPGVDFDRLDVTGTVTLGGTLHVVDINGFVPGGTDTIVPLTAGSITGKFDSANAQVNYGSTSLTVAALPTPLSQLLNIATRMRVQTGENVLIGGFIITGSASKQVIVRGIGPSLSAFFSGTLSNPTLELFQGNTLLQSNDDWKSDQRTEIEASGIPPTNDLEAAIVRTLAPGAYTAILRGQGNSTGIGVVEAYDLDAAANSQLANIATRGFVETGDNVMIGGLIIGPANGTNARVVVRAIGPSLGNFGIVGAVQDPVLDFVNANGVALRSNDNWKLGGQQTELIALGLQPGDDRESALIETVSPGAYTAIVRGRGGTTGVSLVEVYNVP